MPYVLEAPVLENRRFPHHNYILTVRAPEIARRVQPGQFVMAAELGNQTLPYPLLKRALAVYTVVEEEGKRRLITLLLKTIGDGTRRLAALQPGDSLSLIGPLGNGFGYESGPDRIHLLVAGGIGIASVYLLAVQLLESGQDVRLVYGGRSADDLVGLEDFQKLDIPILVTTNDGSLGFRGLVTEGLSDYISGLDKKLVHIYTCGPNPMMKAVSSLAQNAGIPCQISVEARMACGFGVCLGCSVKTTHGYRLACRHGPVFQAQEFVWEEQ